MGCCGGLKVAPAVTRLLATRDRPKPVSSEPVVMLREPVIVCPYCGVTFSERVAEARPGLWVIQKWCTPCGLRFR